MKHEARLFREMRRGRVRPTGVAKSARRRSSVVRMDRSMPETMAEPVRKADGAPASAPTTGQRPSASFAENLAQLQRQAEAAAPAIVEAVRRLAETPPARRPAPRPVQELAVSDAFRQRIKKAVEPMPTPSKPSSAARVVQKSATLGELQRRIDQLKIGDLL